MSGKPFPKIKLTKSAQLRAEKQLEEAKVKNKRLAVAVNLALEPDRENRYRLGNRM